MINNDTDVEKDFYLDLLDTEVISAEISCLILQSIDVETSLPVEGGSMKTGNHATDDAKLGTILNLIENGIGWVEAAKHILRRASPDDRALIASMAAAVACCSRVPQRRADIKSPEELKAYNRAAQARSRAKRAEDPVYKEKQKELSRDRSRALRSTAEGARAACEAVKRSQRKTREQLQIVQELMPLRLD